MFVCRCWQFWSFEHNMNSWYCWMDCLKKWFCMLWWCYSMWYKFMGVLGWLGVENWSSRGLPLLKLYFCLLVQGEGCQPDDWLLVIHPKQLMVVSVMTRRSPWSTFLSSQAGSHYDDGLEILTGWHASPRWRVTRHAVRRCVIVPVDVVWVVGSDIQCGFVVWMINGYFWPC